MITALNVTVKKGKTKINKIINKLRRDKVSVRVLSSRGVKLKYIDYISFNGKVNLDRIDDFVGAQRNHLLCSENIKFSPETGYKRFFSPEFSERLCTNMALYAVQSCKNPENLKIGIYDTAAVASDILPLLLRYCPDVTVVTQNEAAYLEQTELAMEEFGATAMVTKNTDSLEKCHLIIAPECICENLPVGSDAVVLTNYCPSVPLSGLVYYKYYFKMPNGFDSIKLKELDEEYFCSALYTLGGQHELGSIIPTICRNYSSSQTVASLCANFERFTCNLLDNQE
jgi:hypothetical protein